MKYLKEYNDVITRYKAGEFGDKCLSLRDILNKAEEPELINRMNLSEIQYLLDSSTGMTKGVFSLIKRKKKDEIIRTECLEKELKQYNIDKYRDSDDSSDEVLAHNLKLVVRYCDNDELPSDTEAMLCPIDDDLYLGTIKIQKGCSASNFSFRHELIHYFRDVRVGNRVNSEFTRKTKGKTPNDEEQEINYLTAASIMPIEEIRTKLDEFENAITKEDEEKLLSDLAKQYEQDKDAILRRLVEVRCLIDYANIADVK